jgi:hypothetical protein
MDQLKPEIEALLSFLIYRFSVYTNTPSPGNQLQNLRYLSTWIADDNKVPNLSQLLSNQNASSPSSAASSVAPLVVSNLSLTQRLSYGFLVIGLRWGWSRLSQLMLNAGWSMLPEVCSPSHLWVMHTLVHPWTLGSFIFVSTVADNRLAML